MFSAKLLLLLNWAFCYGIPSVSSASCKFLPEDLEWPSTTKWDKLNSTVEGRLIRTVPLGSPCHLPNFNETRCTIIQESWSNTLFQAMSPTSIDATLFTNNSCNPFTQPSDQCIIGLYPQYVVNVSKPADIVAAVQFARKNNIRFVIKNTGHDLMRRNLGAGSLSVWTHNLQERIWMDNYTSSVYSGPAVKVAAGVMADTLYQDAAQRRYSIVAGTFPSVGLAGGYIQGGGHSVLTNLHGLAADQTLEFEVVTTSGKLVRASPTENGDLYWALSGGGGSTYGIVWSVTVKVFPDIQATSGVLVFGSSDVSLNSYWGAIDTFYEVAPNLIDNHIFTAPGYTQSFFSLTIFAPKKSKDEVMGILLPVISSLNSSHISFNLSLASYDNFRSAFLAITGPDVIPGSSPTSTGYIVASCLIPRSISPSTSRNIAQLVRKFAEQGGSVSDVVVQPNFSLARNTGNAVLPAWRNAQRHTILAVSVNGTPTVESIRPMQQALRAEFGDTLEMLTPGSGAYLNEADFALPDWKVTFFGDNYPRLLSIKDKWDPDEVLYASTTVGSDRWVEQPDGRLCKVSV